MRSASQTDRQSLRLWVDLPKDVGRGIRSRQAEQAFVPTSVLDFRRDIPPTVDHRTACSHATT